MAVPVRVLLQVGDNEPNEVGEVPASPASGKLDVAHALRELADEIERPEN